jgi:N utilization substance protein B
MTSDPDKTARAQRLDTPGPRRTARAYAMQVLYALDGKADERAADGDGAGWASLAVAQWDQAFELDIELDDATRAFARTLVERAVTEAARVDELIASASRNWRLERMSRVDRNILRLATGELLPASTGAAPTPVRIVINEAIELAKRFGTAESAAFVNGILDRVAAALGRGPES